MSGEPVVCEICTSQPHKYTCPVCDLKFCSVPCWKRHKESPCKPSLHPRVIDDQVYVVTPRQFSELASSVTVRKLLQNPALQEKIRSIDSAPKAREALLNKALEEDKEFAGFVNVMLQVVRIRSATGKCIL